MQVKLIVGTDYTDLEEQINVFVSAKKDAKVDVDFKNVAAIVTYGGDPKTLCCDCRFWDDSGEHDKMIGLCQCNGGRRRFNDKSCEEFKDMRW